MQSYVINAEHESKQVVTLGPVRKPRAQYHHGSLREAALDAAAREIDLHGHVGFSLDGVAKRLGVTPAALYRHFKNRDDLLREVIWVRFQSFVAALDAAAARPDAADRMLEIGMAYVRFGLENPGWFRVQFSREGARLSDRQESVHPVYQEVLQHELTGLFPSNPKAVEKWYLALWACLHGIAGMAVEHTLPPMKTDAQRLGAAEYQLSTVLEGLRAAARQR